MTFVVQRDERFDLLQDGETVRWWQRVLAHAQATVAMASGDRIYVADSVEDLGQIGRELAFLELHVVSVATWKPYEFSRTIHTPALRRFFPVSKVASIAPIVDAETAVPA